MDHGVPVSRRAFLAAGTAMAAALLSGCGGRLPREDQPAAGDDGGPAGRLRARPGPGGAGAPQVGLHPLGVGNDRDGLLFVPSRAEAGGSLPVVVMLHGAGGRAGDGLAPFVGLADEAGVILLAPDSRGRTWDVILGGFGPDVAFIDHALEHTFARCAVDPDRVAVEGFSDGASYALGLGLANGDLFRRIVAFSPGYVPGSRYEGRPSVFVSHGTGDDVLPIDRCSRRIVPRLKRAGYEVRYREFDGPHRVPAGIAREAIGWFTTDSL